MPTSPRPLFRNPVISDSGGRDHGDPFVLKYLDTYYLYHTTNDGLEGISVFTSRDLVEWAYEGIALDPATGEDHWAQTELWAPEVMYQDGVFYMYVSATRKAPQGHDDDPSNLTSGKGLEEHRRQGMARATSPLGPFEWYDEPLVADEWTIDGHPLRDQDGTLWLIYNTRQVIWSHEPGQEFLAAQTGNVIDQMLTPDTLMGRPTIVSFPSEDWEGNGDFYWNEGAWVVKRAPGQYKLLYSGGYYRDSSYGVGLMQARHPRGPWIKYAGNPIFRSSEQIAGPGHPSIALAPDNVTPYIVYHGYVPGTTGRKVHLDRVRWSGGIPVMGRPYGKPTPTDQVYPPQAVYDRDVPFWLADFWVRGSWIQVGPNRVELPNSHWHRVQVRQGLDGVKVWFDDRLVSECPSIGPFELETDGETAALAVTSHLEDIDVHTLEPGQFRTWQWGGSTPLELSMAVSGTCYVRFGVSEVKVEHPTDEYRLFRINADQANQLRVRAGDEQVRVTDLFIAAREKDYVDPWGESR